jgi:neurotransmitter:Na+ symporter, NSS family
VANINSPGDAPLRGAWQSRFGFILAASGSAIGLGNIWRFPYSAAEGGGGIFVAVYLFFVLVIGVPVLLAELSIGRHTQRNPVGAFKAIIPRSMWPALGGLGVATGFGILAFYSVVAGWTLGYLWRSLMGDMNEITAEQSSALFGQIISDPYQAIALAGVFILLTVLVVRAGIAGGIERASKILMPLLFVLLLVLAGRAVTLPGAAEGVAYLFRPDFSELTASVVLGALGQALFSLSLGMGAMITYGSYMPKSENLVSSGLTVAFFDTLIAILAGLIIFPAIFATGGDIAAGPGLVFVVLPTIFAAMPAGDIFAIAFYTLLAIAALTSTISLLEVVVAYLVDERRWTRNRAVTIIGVLCFLLAVPSALSQGASEMFTSFVGGVSWLDLQNIIFGNYALSLGALLLCVFVGWRWGTERAVGSLEASGHRLPAPAVFSFLVKFVCPIAIAIVLLFIIITGSYF